MPPRLARHHERYERRVRLEARRGAVPRLPRAASGYEQALYLHCFRHSRLVGQREVVIGFKSARRRIATGIGEAGKPMSEGTCYKKLKSLARKGCIEVVDSTREGMKVRVHVPAEIPGVLPPLQPERAEPNLESVDFFTEPARREAILRREGGRCFYCLRELNGANWLVEHVRSRPHGDSSYRNVVAACRACNNRKGSRGRPRRATSCASFTGPDCSRKTRWKRAWPR